jgi:hypothetical protein
MDAAEKSLDRGTLLIRNHRILRCKSRQNRAKIAKVDDRGTSLMRNSAPLEPYSRTMPRALWQSWGGGRFLISEVTLYDAMANPAVGE